MTGFCHFLGNRQPHIRRDKSETQVLEFNDGNNELQENGIKGSGSKILVGKSQEELEELAIALGEVSIWMQILSLSFSSKERCSK
jgi:hypothetical protein